MLLKYFGKDSVVKTPNNIKRIGKDCFINDFTTQIIISSNVETIGDNAFIGAKALESVIFTSDFPPKLDGSCFEEKVVIYVKESRIEEYQKNICFVNLPNVISKKEITINFYDIDNKFLGSKVEYYGSIFDNYIDAPTIVGKDFCYWECDGSQFNVNDIIDQYNNINLKAIYETSKYQINITDDNGVKQIVLEYGQEIDISLPEKDGKIFKGWFDEPIGGNLIIDTSKKCVWDKIVSGSTLYPQYELIKYTITYNFANADKIFDEPTEFTVDTPVFKSLLKSPEKFGYLFVGWNCNGSKFENTKGIYKNIELVAEWKGRIILAKNQLSVSDQVAIIDFTDASHSENYSIEITSSVKMITFIANSYAEYVVTINIANRNSAVLLGLKNINIIAPAQNNTINCKSAALYVSYWGEVIVKGGDGLNGSGAGADGTNGGYGIYAKSVTLMAFDDSSFIAVYGGNGGNGTKGEDGKNGENGANPPSGSIFKPVKGDNGKPGGDGKAGGDGGNGGYAIYASDKIINVTRGGNYEVRGGDGGNGGNGGDGGKGGNGADDVSGDWFHGTGDPGDGGNGGNGGTNGVAGSAAQGTNCESIKSAGGINGVDGETGYAGEGGKGGNHGVIGEDGNNGKDGIFGKTGSPSIGEVGALVGQPVSDQKETSDSIVELPPAYSSEFFETILK